MRHAATRHLAIPRLVLALLCLACTGAFAVARGVARVDATSGTSWMAAPADQHLAPARTPQLLGLLRDGERVDARAGAECGGPAGPPHSAPHFLLATITVVPRVQALRAAARPPSRNRAPYYATAPPALP